MTVGSLFSGVGGLDLGLEWAGFETKWFCEIEQFPQQVLKNHWPGVPVYDDVKKIKADAVVPVDVIAGGFPCQDISWAGVGRGINYDLSEQEGTRSGLWWEMWRVIRDLRPRYVIAENVPALTHRGLDIVLGSLAQIGYDAEWQTISAASVGAPHIRERVFIVAYPCGIRSHEPISGYGHSEVEWAGSGFGCENRIFDKVGRKNTEFGSPDFWPSGEWDAHLATDACISDMGRKPHGIPDSLDTYGHRTKGLGNAVVPQVGYLVGRAVMAHAFAQADNR